MRGGLGAFFIPIPYVYAYAIGGLFGVFFPLPGPFGAPPVFWWEIGIGFWGIAAGLWYVF
jgi:hypothetical protein